MEKLAVNCFVSKEFQVAESIKTLRTNLMFSGTDIQVIGMTSHTSSEGKSTISFQLAASLAQAGKRVLLLDADLRKSSLQHKLRVRNRVDGLSHYLSGMANVNDLLCSTDVNGLYIMFAGVRVPNSAELLGSKQFKKLIPALREVFDYVIVDTAPLGQVIDCAVIAPELDGTVIVIDTTNNSYKQGRQLKQQLEKSGGKILGVVLNRVEPKSKDYHYGGYAVKESETNH